MDRGFFITLQAIRRQLAAMPNELYLLRLIHHHTRKPFPAEPLWTPWQLSRCAVVRFLRWRNREGFDVYLRPYAESRNAGYILLDLDRPGPPALHRMRAQGHEPCVVLQTSAGHLQAWVRVSPAPLEPARATAIGRYLAHAYGGDLASTDWRHLGRLAGFTNQKPARRHPSGYAPWVRLLHAQTQSATNGPSLIQAAERWLSPSPNQPICQPMATNITPAAAAAIYQRFLDRLRIPQRFPQPDWSVADLWIAQELFRCRTPAEQVQAILRLGSPGFPRRHSKPGDYLARTLRRAALDVEHARFSARRRAPGVEASRDP
jgi:hypothetical protein